MLTILRARCAEWHRRDEGATAVEYGLMVSLIALVIVGAVTLFGSAVQGLFQSAVTAWPK